MTIQRKGGEWNFEGSCSYECICRFVHPSPRRLEGIVAKLEPLSKQDGLLKFLRNTNNAKTITGFVRELADAVTDYQV